MTPGRITIDEIRHGGFATPWGAPSAPPFPFSFRNAEILTLAYRSEPDAIARILPPPLELTSDTAMIHIYRMNDVDWLGAYSEANVMVGARLPEPNIEGAYSPFLFLSSDGGVIQGREVHGQPKKLGEPRLEARGDLWVGIVARNGIDVVTGALAYKQHRDRLESLAALLPFATNINLKAIDHIDGRPAIRQLTSRFLTDVIVHECWSGPCSVELRANMQAPVFRLPVREPLAGFYWRADFTLVAGSILYDYLAQERSSAWRNMPGC